jgi:cell cycle checkpoint control protein RAD9A
MNYELAGTNLKVFAKAVQCLSKIGDYIYFDAYSGKLLLRSSCSSRSAYCHFSFSLNFFQLQSRRELFSRNQEDALHCCLLGKTLTPLFKTCLSGEKLVEHCQLCIPSSEETTCELKLRCKYGVEKIYNFNVIVGDLLPLITYKEKCRTVITLQNALLSELLLNFPSNIAEITLSVKETQLCLKSCDAADSRLHTEFSIECKELLEYAYQRDLLLTFPVRGLRAFLCFCEGFRTRLTLYLDEGGRPISVFFSDICQAELILSTCDDEDVSSAPFTGFADESNVTFEAEMQEGVCEDDILNGASTGSPEHTARVTVEGPARTEQVVPVDSEDDFVVQSTPVASDEPPLFLLSENLSEGSDADLQDATRHGKPRRRCNSARKRV